MVLNSKFGKLIIAFFILLAFVTSLWIVSRRVAFEFENRTVEVQVSYREMQELAILAGTTVKDLFLRMKKETNIRSVSVEEDTLQDLIDEGRVTLLKGSDITNLHRVGHVNRFILKEIYQRVRKIDPYKFYLIIDRRNDFERIRDFFQAEFGRDAVKKIGRRDILEVLDIQEDLLSIGLGISIDRVKWLEKNGFRVSVRLKNSKRLSPEVIRTKFRSLEPLTNVKTVIFDEASVLGYPSELSYVEKKIRSGGYNIGYIEFLGQKGFKSLAQAMPERTLRVHSIPLDQMAAISEETARRRYIRAAKERGIRILFVRPFVTEVWGASESLISRNFNYFDDIISNLSSFGYQSGIVENLDTSKFISLTTFETFLLSLGVLAFSLFVVHHFLVLTLFKGIFVLILFSLGFYFFHLFYLVPVWNQIMATVTAVLVPTYAIISQFPIQNDDKPVRRTVVLALFYLIRIVLISLIGALLIVAFLSDLPYLLGLSRFSGVKISFVLPLILIGLFFFLRPHRIPSFFFVFKRVIFAPIRTVSLVATLVSLAFVFIYVLRSGNYFTFNVPFIEDQMRILLEDVFTIRPRTKEFLIGYPFLFLAYYYVDRVIPRSWLWFFNMLGCVALISFINSFCHLHTPVLISVYRSMIGVLLGVGVGLVYLALFKFIRWSVKRMV